jgi:hypothetical protein
MYLRVTKVRRGSRFYKYVQLVESFRRADGKPTNRVLANLGSLDDIAVANLRAALAATRKGKALVVENALFSDKRAEVHQSLRYLDLAVLLRVWDELNLEELLSCALPKRDQIASPVDMVKALVLQRCVAPSSKLAAERWYPKTALPELLSISPHQFNNSRIHRVLSSLEEGEAVLQEGLPAKVKAAEGGFAALFIDATDTWFVGNGPPLAHKARDKEGVYRRRIGLVMLCDQRGNPLRWETLSGRYHDPTALADMAKEAATVPWAKNLPVVLDRASGTASATETLHARGLHYVTAIPDPELESSCAPIPWDTIDALQGETTKEGVQQQLVDAGFVGVGKGKYLLDLGIFEKAPSARSRTVPVAVFAVRALSEHEAGPTQKAAAERLGISARTLRYYAQLRSLTGEVRARILEEQIDRLSIRDLMEVAKVAPEEQLAFLERKVVSLANRPRQSSRVQQASGYPARAVISVCSRRVLSDREKDEQNLLRAQTHVADVNRRLGHPSNRRTDGSALAEVEGRLRKFRLRGVFTPHITGKGTNRRIVLEKNDTAWARRRRGDGINVVVAHPSVQKTAEELVNQYFAKDAIERDFRTIKSVVELRPIHHRTDPKVRAHVTICILALLLLRALEHRLEKTGVSAASALETMEPVRLNVIAQDKAAFYSSTRPDANTTALLQTLGYNDLMDDTTVRETITPRPSL